MKDRFTPDYMFDTYDLVTPEFLLSIGIKHLLIDIDNTLAPYEQPLPDEKIIAWLASLAKHGINAALVSNNNAERVEKFNSSLGLPAYPDSGKPKKKNVIAAMQKLGGNAHDTAVLGDQLLTDAYSGKRLGMIAIIVPPIKDKKTLFFGFKRFLEKPFVAKYRRIEKKKRKEDNKL